MKKKRWAFILLASLLCFSSACTAPSVEEVPVKPTGVSQQAVSWEEAQTTPFGKYPEPVLCTIGRKSRGYTEEQAIQEQVYTYSLFLQDFLNVRFCNAFDVRSEEDFRQKVSMSIASGDLPDIMTVNAQQLYSLYEEDLIADLTEAYETCASPRIKEIYDSYEGRCLNGAIFDGKLMALPTTEMSHGPGYLWLRKDWMEKLGLQEPQTMEDIEEILRRFIADDPGNNGPGQTVGLLCGPQIAGDSSGVYMLNAIFTLYGAFPQQWFRTNSGEIVYGSVQPEMKPALERVAGLYRESLLDPKFMLRTEEDCQDLLAKGISGSFFGNYWSSELLLDSLRNNPKADWTPYLVPKNEDGAVTMFAGNPNSSFIVVRKGFAHPEAAVKLASIQFDYVRDKAPEFTSSLNQDGMLLNMHIGYDDAFVRSGALIQKALERDTPLESFSSGETSNDLSVRSYLDAIEKGEPPNPRDWQTYKSRVEAYNLLMQTPVQKITPIFVRETDFMRTHWPDLKNLEQTVLLKIVTGEQPIEAFDDFADRWNQSGGSQITEELRQIYG